MLGDVVGLGKTVQTIATALHLRNVGKVDLVLCVVPASLKIKWSQEIDKFCEEKWSILKTKAQSGGEDLYLHDGKGISTGMEDSKNKHGLLGSFAEASAR